ncbi:MAG: benzoate-CoA ligase family protein [Alphaproteobacteria bacterium]|nr:benzoate-CoA ligase family protein [Alphaproteobacteria bacterium]
MSHYNAAQDLLSRNLTAERRDRVAFIDHRGRWRFAQVAERSARFANLLIAAGIDEEQRVVLCLHDSVDFPTCFLGAMQRGAVPIPINTRLTPQEQAFILRDSRARALVISEDLLPALAQELGALPDLRCVWVSGGDGGARPALEPALAAQPPLAAFARTRPADMAFWLYSSGTTGQPKGVVHAHSHLIATAERYAGPVLSLTQHDVVYSAAKLFFAYGLGNGLTFPMAAGATCVLLHGPPTPEAVCALLAEHRPTLFFGVPTLYGMLLAHEALLPAAEDCSIRLCVSAGEALPPALMQRWWERLGVEILDGIGSTEALHIFLSNRAGQVRPGSSGTPVPGYEVRLLDDAGQPVPVGELGNLEVRGPSTALMYWNRRARSQEVFQGEWMRTGDSYVQNADGTYSYGGRGDDMMKVGGIWVSPFEVESALLEHPAVFECGVVAKEDHDRLAKPCAYVVLREGVVADQALREDLIAHARERMASFKRPRWVRFVEELPKTATGKIRRFRLRELAGED